MLTSEIKDITYRDQNMAVLFNVAASPVYSLQNAGKYVIKVYNFFRFGVCSQYFKFFPSIICADKRSGGCKISSRYFIKLLSIPRYRAYLPIPS